MQDSGERSDAVTTAADHATLPDLLARWLPAQRWYSGGPDETGAATAAALGVTAETVLRPGEPELRHLVISTGTGARAARYQLMLGLRTELPPGLGHAVIGTLPDGRIAYDGLHDPELSTFLLRAIADQREIGDLAFAREPGARFDLALASASARVIAAEQSNTSVVFGDTAILKVLRRLFPGANPDLEVAGALARLGSTRVAPPYGWVQSSGDEPVLMAVLSRFLAKASDGWSLAAASLGRLFARHGDYGREYLMAPVPRSGPEQPGPNFAEEAHLLGRATAELHADLATAFGTEQLTKQQLGALADDLTAKLTQVTGAVPELARYEGKIRAAYRDLAELTMPVATQRIHGDYHLGQVLRTDDGWVALDFEGEPMVPLEQRTALYPALRDVAGMLRSFDYAARHQLLAHPDARQLAGPADKWVDQCQQAFCGGYARAGGLDPDANSVLLRALLLEKAVYEVRYEASHRPAWLSIPLDYIAAA
jgi:maltokinase